ncbi:PAS domain-containing protein [Rhizobium sp. CFBP 8762]|uniref:PAS domain-containing protein n=1 Tax=Rhizobium sp. CFBP 8762 TaxID=2775279 RepID=UPI0017870548|nr:PAS domain-containing protein [Rhizobium sp. CFBP 8762]MBD8556413.1 PAS domain-containing protein [Rhizobium sp. CFBP 8762]
MLMSSLSPSVLSTEDRLDILERKLDAGIWMWDLQTSEVTWSPGIYRLTGLDPAKVRPSLDVYHSLMHPEDRLSFGDTVGLVEGPTLKDRKFRVILPYGRLRWMHSRAQTYYGRNGEPTHVVGVLRDITEEVAIENALKTETATNQTIGKLINGCVWRASADGKLLDTAAWTRLTGQTTMEARNWDDLSGFHPDDRQMFSEHWAAAVANASDLNVTVRVRKADGSYVTMTHRATPLRNGQGAIDQWIGISKYVSAEPMRMGAKTDVKLLPQHIRAGRAFLGWSGPRLAKEAKLSFSTVRRMEQSADIVRDKSLRCVLRAFEEAGISFGIGNDGSISMTVKPL